MLRKILTNAWTLWRLGQAYDQAANMLRGAVPWWPVRMGRLRWFHVLILSVLLAKFDRPAAASETAKAGEA